MIMIIIFLLSFFNSDLQFLKLGKSQNKQPSFKLILNIVLKFLTIAHLMFQAIISIYEPLPL